MPDHFVVTREDRRDDRQDRGLSRRAALRQTFGDALALGTGRVLAAEPMEGELIVRNQRPLDLEGPVSALNYWLTPNDLFYVRSHFGAPAVGLHPWQLEVGGLVDRPGMLSLHDLEDFETVNVIAVLQCAGNGRGFFKPTVPGVAWERGGVGQANWSGVRLADILKRAGLHAEAQHVHLLGADSPPSPKTPAYLRSIPLERALHPSTLLVTQMNGVPLPVLHGGPLRLAVPGWTGNHWIKWLRKLTLAGDEAPGSYMRTGYKMPKAPAPPGAVLKPEDLVSVTTMNVKSLITAPLAESAVMPGTVVVRGIAWTGDGHVTKVEFATGRSPVWTPATLLGDEQPGRWRPWRFSWTAFPGRQTLRVRATDSNGQTQPEITPWNKSGYLWNGIDQVSITVREV